jgi:hypothetical protein
MQDTIEITLPISESKVEIRNYTTRADDERSEQVLYRGVEIEQRAKGANKSGDEQKITFPIANVMAAQESYIPRLVQSIDGDSSNIKIRLTELRSEDYEAVEKAVEKVVDEHSPKAKEAKKASKNN